MKGLSEACNLFAITDGSVFVRIVTVNVTCLFIAARVAPFPGNFRLSEEKLFRLSFYNVQLMPGRKVMNQLIEAVRVFLTR
jgi:hypothetical protein